MVKCPYCGRPAMSLLHKSSLGPGRAVSCQSRGRMVSAHWIGIFSAVPAFLGGFALMKSAYAPIGFAAVVGGVLALGLIHTFLVPLLRSDALAPLRVRTTLARALRECRPRDPLCHC